MNHSLIVAWVHGPGFPPDHLSIVAWTTSFGRWTEVTGHFFVYSRMKARHSGAAAVSDVAGFAARGNEWSLLPIQTPTTRPTPSFLGGRNPYVPRSRASFVLPVFPAAGRRRLPSGPRSSVFAAQMSFCAGSVFPARMSVTSYAAPADTARVPSGLGAAHTTVPSGPRTSSTIRGASRTPPLAIVPYADARSSGRTSTVPSAPARQSCRNAPLPPAKRILIFSAVMATRSLPTRWSARIAGMFSEYWSALRTRTGPRSSWSASRGAQSWPRSNSVVTSSRRLPGVSRLASNALAYRTGFHAEPGCRAPSPATSYLGSNLRLARSSRP